MKTKSKKIFGGVVSVILLISWIVYFINSYSLFSEVKELTTPGTTYMIKLLEFTNYRAEQLSLLLVTFFILISVNNILTFYFYSKKKIEKDKLLLISVVSNLIIIAIICAISSVFWSIYIILALLSGLVVATSFYVSNMFWGNKIIFDEGDIIYRSDAFQKEERAKEALKEQTKKMKITNSSVISSDIFMMDDEYYFEVYANEKVILNNEGEISVYEKK